MKFGLFSMNAYACSSPENAVRIAQLAESAGFTTVALLWEKGGLSQSRKLSLSEESRKAC